MMPLFSYGGYIGGLEGLYRDDGKENGNAYLGFPGFCFS